MAAREATPQNGWWKAYHEVVPGGYLDLIAAEEDAAEIVHFHPTFVPGLLQTKQYAKALIPSTSLKDLSERDIESLVEVRMMRQRSALDEAGRRRLIFLLDESCLYRPVGSAETMRSQLNHLLEMCEHPAVVLSVIPFRSELHPGLLGPFMLLRSADSFADVVCFEWQRGNTLVRGEPDLARRYGLLADRLVDADPDGAKRLIQAAIIGLSTEASGGAEAPPDGYPLGK
ncbi:hypothetical protein SAMN05421812_103458 [Asanoa hainanensis]|uniref:DUF5753 domain-containing protein n=1 Tax=Asanoa hainanensis TaxID=560556 RepID=A0A239KG10_9ACTN|nr:DUF5753 domain-containing protein [Asanoa hainanensis]SNT16064.1 hypothetical protein SAMN05421812_103458 [Asanoa hainanensis]